MITHVIKYLQGQTVYLIDVIPRDIMHSRAYASQRANSIQYLICIFSVKVLKIFHKISPGRDVHTLLGARRQGASPPGVSPSRRPRLHTGRRFHSESILQDIELRNNMPDLDV